MMFIDAVMGTENILLEDIYFQINDQLYLEVLLVEIRGKKISYSCS